MPQTSTTEHDVNSLIGAACAPHLRHLCVYHPWQDLDAISTLVRAPSLDGLVTLQVARHNFHEAYLKALIGSPRLPNLRNLILAGGCGAAVLDALAGSSLLSRLRRLQVRFESAQAANAARLARAVADTAACCLILHPLTEARRQAEQLTAEFPGRVLLG
jgi:hypothetical protein